FIAHQLSFLSRNRIVELASALLVCGLLTRVIYASTRGIQNLEVPVQFIQMIPYIVTIVVLAGFIGQSRAPRALGTPYQKER
ncbi:MAG TPA: hypothetical protein VN956_10280, partial [Pyrinomonadaceae bacterium]|nr:hypothetical protein [Pyrinomonadaceae bacterium]